jgi:hypothetical protein
MQAVGRGGERGMASKRYEVGRELRVRAAKLGLGVKRENGRRWTMDGWKRDVGKKAVGMQG